MNMQEPKIPEVAEDLDGITVVKNAHQFLKQNSLAGALIGGKASAFLVDRETDIEETRIATRKDLDLLVIQGGTMFNYESPYDLFLPKSDGTYKNRTDCTLPYHLHYLGENLSPGLYLLPPEVIYLTEFEMATRRAIDRIVPDLINVKLSPLAQQFGKLPLNDLVLEFPGDFQWFGASKPLFPLQLLTREEGGGRRNYISFNWRTPNAMPRTAFPSEKEVRTPDIPNCRTNLPNVDLQPADFCSIGFQQIWAGYVKEGVKYLSEKCPEEMDDLNLLEAILKHSSNLPLQVCEAFAIWLNIALKNGFHTLYALDGSFHEKYKIGSFDKEYQQYKVYKTTIENQIRSLSGIIATKFGSRYENLSEKFIKFSFDGMSSVEVPQSVKAALKALILSFNFSRSYNETSVLTKSNQCSYKIQFNIREFINSSSNPGKLFTEEYYALANSLDITEEEIANMVLAAITRCRKDGLGSNMNYGNIQPHNLNKTAIENGKTLFELAKFINDSDYTAVLAKSIFYGNTSAFTKGTIPSLLELCEVGSLKDLKVKLLSKISRKQETLIDGERSHIIIGQDKAREYREYIEKFFSQLIAI